MHKIFVLVGASGSGKTAIIESLSLMSQKIVTTTTRLPRSNEQDGIDYNFLSKENFLRRDFVERDTKYTNYYGTEVHEVDRKLKTGDAFAILTHQGYISFKEKYGENVIGIFIKSSKEDLMKMIESRGEINVKRRMQDFEEDLKNSIHYDYVLTNKFGEWEETKNKFLDILDRENFEATGQ